MQNIVPSQSNPLLGKRVHAQSVSIDQEDQITLIRQQRHAEDQITSIHQQRGIEEQISVIHQQNPT